MKEEQDPGMVPPHNDFDGWISEVYVDIIIMLRITLTATEAL